MARFNNPLSNVKVAAPCSADWDGMIGNERVRFCGQCSRNVFNLSSMTKREAENLIEHTEGRVCIRFYRRTDGTVLTDNCPVGLRAIRRRVRRVASAFVSVIFTFFAGVGFYVGAMVVSRIISSRHTGTPMMGAMVTERPVRPVVVTPSEPVVQGEMVMGRMKIEPIKNERRPHARSPR